MLEPCWTFNSVDTWLGIDTSTSGTGEPRRLGCDVHCENVCPQVDDLSVQVTTTGARHGRPIRHRPSRNAEGMVTALRSVEPQLFPPEVHMERGACWQNGNPAGTRLVDGMEWWGPDRIVCECDPWLDKLYGDQWHRPGQADCRDGTFIGFLREGPRPDLWTFTGHDYSEDFWIWGYCRHEIPFEHRALPFALQTSHEQVYPPLIARFGFCQHDLLSICAGAKHHTSNCLPAQSGFHNDHSDRAVWNRFYILNDDWFNVWLEMPADVHSYRSPAFAATFAAQNRALAFAGDVSNLVLDQLENNQITGPWTANSNINIWQRRYDGPSKIYMSDADGLHGRLKHAGCPVDVMLTVIEGSYVAMHFSLWKMKDRTGPAHQFPDSPSDYFTRLMPSVQIHVHLELAMNAHMGTPCVVERPYMQDGNLTLAVSHSGSRDKRFPTVQSSPDAGEVDYVEVLDADDTVFTPPTSVDWWGELQELTESHAQWYNVWPYGEPGGDIRNVCCAAARAVNMDHPLKIWGLATDHTGVRADAQHKINHYKGYIQVALDTTAMCSSAEVEAVA